MVETNNDEERLARVEHMIEKLQRQSVTLNAVTAKLVVAVAVLTKASTKPPRAYADRQAVSHVREST
jgi:hypothetical protein